MATLVGGTVVVAWLLHVALARTTHNFDADWLFALEVHKVKKHCEVSEFPDVMDSKQCAGLKQAGENVTSIDQCRDLCCQQHDCEVWQYCPAGAECDPKGTCWIGMASECYDKPGWVSRKRQLIKRPTDLCNDDRCKEKFNDSKWRSVKVPHDFEIEERVQMNNTDRMHGYRNQHVGWYRKYFEAPEFSPQRAYAWLEFDGIYRNSQIWLNGQYVGGQASGYTSFTVPVTQYLKYGKKNVLSVRADAKTELEGWWYEGGGIYRHTRMVFAPWAHAQDLFVAPNVDPISISEDGMSGTVEVNTTFEVFNSGALAVDMIAVISLFDLRGMKVGYQEKLFSVSPSDVLRMSAIFDLVNASLWSTDHPYLYSAEVELFQNGAKVDTIKKKFGARYVRWDKDTGLYINNQRVKLKGFCNHQDFAGVGVAVPDRINYWKVAKLQEMGSNAWRMSHGPPNPELLDFTDELGMLVMDEHRSYCERTQRICNETGFLDDLRRMLRRDRSHPSVIMWSFCNEAGCSNVPNDEQALLHASQMKQIVEANDPVNTRAVTGGWYSKWEGLTQGWAPKIMDVQGINYFYDELGDFHNQFPDKPMVSTESGSCLSARGVYFTNVTEGQIDEYSRHQCTEDWVKTIDPDYISGGFGWTGFDYHGEPVPTFWPAANSNFGVLDLAGFPKDSFYWHQAWWTNKDVLHILPHWNKPEGYVEKASEGTCDISGFPIDFADQRCYGLRPVLNATTIDDCMKACCEDTLCEVYSWTTLENYCYIGPMDMNMCEKVEGWRGGGRRKVVRVWAFGNAPRVELSLNGESLGMRDMPRLEKVEWKVPYEPGRLEATGYDLNGKVVSNALVETTGKPAQLRLRAEQGHNRLAAHGSDAGLVAVSVLDAEGRVVPTANNRIHFSVKGVGKIIGGHNGNPASHEPEVGSSSFSAYNGWTRIVVGATGGEGKIKLEASSPGLKTAHLEITVAGGEESVLSII